jgi:hypothetical protein
VLCIRLAGLWWAHLEGAFLSPADLSWRAKGEVLYVAMVDAPEPPHQHHPAHTGHRWLDLSLGLSAMFVSVISLVVAVEHGRTMERMADANERMVEANGRMVQASSWPFVEFRTHNVDEHGNADVRLALTNEGIGPARIETFELWWNGQPMSSQKALLEACCATTPAEHAQRKTAQQKNTVVLFVGQTAPSILRAGDHVDFLAIADSQAGDLWSKLNVERDRITVQVCYCSVFDECWRGSGITTQAERVSSCPTPAVPFKIE